MEAEEEQKDNASGEEGQGEQLSLTAIKSITVQEFGRIENQFRDFKDQMCKTIETAEKRSEARLAKITQKIDLLKKVQQGFKQTVDQLNSQTSELEKKTSRLEKAF